MSSHSKPSTLPTNMFMFIFTRKQALRGILLQESEPIKLQPSREHQHHNPNLFCPGCLFFFRGEGGGGGGREGFFFVCFLLSSVLFVVVVVVVQIRRATRRPELRVFYSNFSCRVSVFTQQTQPTTSHQCTELWSLRCLTSLKRAKCIPGTDLLRQLLRTATLR